MQKLVFLFLVMVLTISGSAYAATPAKVTKPKSVASKITATPVPKAFDMTMKNIQNGNAQSVSQLKALMIKHGSQAQYIYTSKGWDGFLVGVQKGTNTTIVKKPLK